MAVLPSLRALPLNATTFIGVLPVWSGSGGTGRAVMCAVLCLEPEHDGSPGMCAVLCLEPDPGVRIPGGVRPGIEPRAVFAMKKRRACRVVGLAPAATRSAAGL